MRQCRKPSPSAVSREVWSTGQSGDAGYELFACALDGGCRVILPSIPPIAILDRAPDGRVLLAGHTSTRGVVAQLAGWGAPRALIVPGEASLSRSISPDGRLAIVSNQYSKEYETYLVRAADGSAVRLSSGDGAQISPDGRQILAVATDAKTVSVTPIGMGTTREIPNPDGVAYEGIPVWIPDDQRFVVTGRRLGGGWIGQVGSESKSASLTQRLAVFHERKRPLIDYHNQIGGTIYRNTSLIE